MDEQATNDLELADWRRRVAQLYVEVRAMGMFGGAAAHDHWRAVRERLYREHPQSPIPLGERAGFTAHHFPYDPALRFEAAVIPEAAFQRPGLTPDVPVATTSTETAPADMRGATVPTSVGGAMGVRRIGWLDVPLPTGAHRFALYWLEGYGGGLFLSFRDGTNGDATYGGGRYLLDGAKSADLGGDLTRGTVLLDFNFAYQPSCAFDPRWVCPLVPPENVLTVPIKAGERLT